MEKYEYIKLFKLGTGYPWMAEKSPKATEKIENSQYMDFIEICNLLGGEGWLLSTSCFRENEYIFVRKMNN